MTETKKYTFGLDKKTACALTYFLGWVSGLVFFLSEKEDKEIRFNAMQSIAVFGILHFLLLFLRMIPFLGWSLMYLLSLFSFILWLILIVKTYQGEKIKLPFIGEIVEKQINK